MIALDIIVSLLIGILAGMGVGSGGFLILYLLLVRDMEQVRAQGINLWFFIFALAAACLVHLRKRKIRLDSLAVMLSFGIAGVLIGSYALSFVKAEWLSFAFGIFLIVSGGWALISKRE